MFSLFLVRLVLAVVVCGLASGPRSSCIAGGGGVLVGLAAVVVYRGVASVEQGARGWCMRRAGACGWLVWLVQHAHGGAGPFFSAFFFALFVWNVQALGRRRVEWSR